MSVFIVEAINAKSFNTEKQFVSFADTEQKAINSFLERLNITAPFHIDDDIFVIIDSVKCTLHVETKITDEFI